MRNVGGCFVNDIRLKVLKRSDDTQETHATGEPLCSFQFVSYRDRIVLVVVGFFCDTYHGGETVRLDSH